MVNNYSSIVRQHQNLCAPLTTIHHHARLELTLFEHPRHHQGSTPGTGSCILVKGYAGFLLQLIGIVTYQLLGFSPCDRPLQNSQLVHRVNPHKSAMKRRKFLLDYSKILLLLSSFRLNTGDAAARPPSASGLITLFMCGDVMTAY